MGTTGAGKTTLGRTLGEVLDAPFYDMDELYWRPGWTNATDEEVNEQLDRIVASPTWVIAGNYRRFRRLRMHLVDLPVWLDLPFHTTYRRLLGRTWRRAVQGELCCNGNYESIRRTLLSPESILWWGAKTYRPLRRALHDEQWPEPYARLRTPRDVERFVQCIRMRARHSDVRHRCAWHRGVWKSDEGP